MPVNRYGLDRYIPVAIKKEIRRRCGFGCVICGNAIFTYEHIEPRFEDARKHDPSRMTLLCGDHQIQSTKGLLSKETIIAADRDPFCKQVGHAKHLFDLGGRRPKLVIGGNDFTECGSSIQVDGRKVLEILAPEKKSQKWRVSATFTDKKGEKLCEIKENELLLNSTACDIIQTATRFSVVSGNKIILELELKPPISLLLTTYNLHTPNGSISIGRSKQLDLGHKLDTGLERLVERDTVIFETRNGSQVVFMTSKFVSPQGLNFIFEGGGLAIGPGV